MNKRITEFQNRKCDRCANKDTDLCEIYISRIDGHAYCPNLKEKITVFRFMSKEEFESFKKSKTLVNETIHQGRTNSIGFCFLNIDDYTPEKALHFLSGIVNFDVCVVFETTKELKKSYGIYAKPIKAIGNQLEDLMNLLKGCNENFTATEYCTTEYNNKHLKLIKYSENIWQQWQPGEEQSNLKWIEVKEDE